MNPADEAALVSIALVPAVVGLLFFLRHKFPNASTNSKTIVIVVVTVVFLAICSLFPDANTGPFQGAQQVIER